MCPALVTCNYDNSVFGKVFDYADKMINYFLYFKTWKNLARQCSKKAHFSGFQLFVLLTFRFYSSKLSMVICNYVWLLSTNPKQILYLCIWVNWFMPFLSKSISGRVRQLHLGLINHPQFSFFYFVHKLVGSSPCYFLLRNFNLKNLKKISFSFWVLSVVIFLENTRKK